MSVKVKMNGNTKTLTEKSDLNFLAASADNNITSTNSKISVYTVTGLICGNLMIVSYNLRTQGAISQDEEILTLPKTSSWGNFYLPLMSFSQSYNARLRENTLYTSEVIPAGTWLRGLFIFPIVK